MLLQTDGPGMILHIICFDLCHNITNSFDKIWTRCKNPNKPFLIDYNNPKMERETKSMVINM